MPYEIAFEDLPVGICAEAVRGGGVAKVQVVEFVSEEDGDTLIDRLEGFGSQILNMLKSEIRPSQVQHLLAVIRRDKSATVYLNELNFVGTVEPKRSVKTGEMVFQDDIADVHRMEFEGVTIPPEAGILLIFSVGWRRALFFDFRPLSPKDQKDRDYDINAQLGAFYSYLLFQSRFKITELEWKNILASQWFPFISLKEVTIRKLISQAKNSWPIDDLAEAIAQEVRDALPDRLARWKAMPSFAEHIPFLEKAVEHYLKSDFISATAILYPRIEGLLRSNQKANDPSGAASQKGLSASALKKAETERHTSTPLLPARFREYLETVYFAAFNPNDSKIKVSRNSVGHGVAAAEECTLKAATISLLLIDQLSYTFSGATTSVATTDVAAHPKR